MCFVRLMERVDGELVLIEQFDTTNCGYGRVVSCQGDYYYMHMVYNYNLKNYDEVRIYRLGPDVEAENLRVCYMPESYTWTTVYENDTGAGFAEYINEVQEQLISGDYLEIGEEGVPALYLGDEEIVWDVPEEVLPRRGLYVYRTDMTNSGVPIYVVRHIFAPSGGGLSLEMDVYYYMYFQESGEYREVEALTTWGNGGRIGQGELVQMWFKEHDGKNYICQVFHIDDYKYLLNVLLMEGNQIHVVSQSIAIPNRVFSFIEKEQYHYM